MPDLRPGLVHTRLGEAECHTQADSGRRTRYYGYVSRELILLRQ